MYKRPDLILILSGKRKSGKDYVCQKLVDYLQANSSVFSCMLITLSAPLKETYATEHGLDYQRLLDPSEYKENYRLDMIKFNKSSWSERKRNEDPSYFCVRAVEKAIKNCGSEGTELLKFKIWIVTDARRRSDLEYFRLSYSDVDLRTVRVVASEDVRMKRGWRFCQGVDDCASECDLDSVKDWDFLVCNNDDSELNVCLERIFALFSNKLK